MIYTPRPSGHYDTVGRNSSSLSEDWIKEQKCQPQLGISLKLSCLVILLFLNGKEWPELNGEKREACYGQVGKKA